ncbi:polysaccharide deacetylase family protein [Halalkalicoccus ordinarius]|uniref:polysaccharide deacetylase family protein n=1 Tax=Halalkalicoccus ordinarius TaxID=3116651 RepID=UPI00300EC29D
MDGEPAGYLVFTYDDGTIEDYEKTFRVHEEYDVPGCVAASPGMLGSSDDWVDPAQLREMYDAGWEVLSHTIKHRAIGEISVTEDVEAGDTEIAVASNRHGRYAGDPVALLDAEGIVAEAVVAGRNGSGDGQYIELEEPIETDVSGDDCYVRYTDEFTREILAESKAQLEEIVGEDQVTGFVYPYERHDGLAAEIVPEYYETTPRAFTGNGLNPSHGSDPFSISREYYEEGRMNEEELATFLDTVANEPDFGILASHSSYDTLTEERISTAIEMALERDIAIVTLQEALDVFGIVEAPDRSTEAADENADETDAPEETESQEREEDEEEQSEGRSPGSSTSSSRCSTRSLVPVSRTTT